MKILKRGNLKKAEEKTTRVKCYFCESELEITRADVEEVNTAADIHDYCFSGCLFTCPVCRKNLTTTEEQEKELGFPKRGYQ